MRDVFDLDVAAQDRLTGSDPTGYPVAFFDVDGACVASAESFPLRLRVDGRSREVTGIRLVATAQAWRGLGLFRTLMTDILARCDADGGLAMLYAEHAALYAPFGFVSLPQHKRVGPPPRVAPAASRARRLDLGRKDDIALLRGLLAARAPVSDHVAVEGGASLFLTGLGGATLHYSAALDAIVVSETDGDVFTVVDLVAAQIPTLAGVLAAVGSAPAWVEVLFPTDKLAWDGCAERDETGLMMRGPMPDAFGRPFMLPPTTEF